MRCCLEVPRASQEAVQGSRDRARGQGQHFNVRCVSGHRVRGERTEGYQALRCPACGEGVFVLPRSPLPYPSPPKRAESTRSGRLVERMVEEDPVELSDPASVSVDLGGDEPATRILSGMMHCLSRRLRLRPNRRRPNRCFRRQARLTWALPDRLAAPRGQRQRQRVAVHTAAAGRASARQRSRRRRPAALPERRPAGRSHIRGPKGRRLTRATTTARVSWSMRSSPRAGFAR